MPTSRLIDINTAAITYRRECLIALGKRLYNTCIGCIKTMNSLLPEDEGDLKYRIIFDDDKYNAIVNSNDNIECPNCNSQFDYNSVEFAELYLPQQDQILLMESQATVWVCEKCGKDNRLDDSQIIESVIQSPFYYRYVPNPPTNDQGIINKLNYHTKMSEWVWLCLENLEESFTRFRDDNWNKDKNFMDETAIDTSLDEEP